jgi:peptide/nickel transport system substrate-binding protein
MALLAAIAVALLAVSGAGGAGAQTPKRGGTVIVAGSQAEPACLNSFRSCGPFRPQQYLDEVLEGAFEIGPRHVRPNLVSHVDRKPPFELTYHIRTAARWSDGVPVSARDFVFTDSAIRRYVPADTEDQDFRAHLATVGSVRALDAKTVRVVLRARSSSWKLLFGFVLPAHALGGEDLEKIWVDRIDNPKTGRPIGSGPFLVDRWERGKRLDLIRNPRYWGPHAAYLDRLVLRFGVSDPEQALRTGELDLWHRRPDPGTEEALRGIPGVRHALGPGTAWEHFEIRVGEGGHLALKSKLVRRALAYGIDRNAMVREVYGAYFPRLRPSESAVLLTTSRHYRPNWSEYRHRPALARRLLEQAGCRKGADGIYSCFGERLSLRLATTGGLRRQLVLERAQRNLRAVGVEIVPVYAPALVFFSQIVVPGRFDIALFTWFLVPDEGSPTEIFRCSGSLNHTGYCQRLVTKDLVQSERVVEPARRGYVLNRADAQMAKDVPVIPLWDEPAAVTMRSSLRGVTPSFPLLAWNAENWWLDR